MDKIKSMEVAVLGHSFQLARLPNFLENFIGHDCRFFQSIKIIRSWCMQPWDD